MKMIGHQHPSKCICHGRNMFFVQPQEILVIIRFVKQFATVYTPVVNVKIVAGGEGGDGLHRNSSK